MKITIDMMVSAAVVGTILHAHISAAIDRDNGSLRRKRNADISAQLPRRAVSATEFRLVSEEKAEIRFVPEEKAEIRFVPVEQMKLAPEDHLEDLWNRAMAVEEGMKLDDRLLQMSASFSFTFSFSMSMPSSPPESSPESAPSGSSFPSSTPSMESSPDVSEPPIDCLEGKTRDEYLLTFLSTVSDPDLINDPSSPQGQALKWIVESDPLAIDPCTYPTIAQRYGLATFYYATVGTGWEKSDDWVGGLEECKWFGVTCGGQSKTTVEKLQLCKCGYRECVVFKFSLLLF